MLMYGWTRVWKHVWLVVKSSCLALCILTTWLCLRCHTPVQCSIEYASMQCATGALFENLGMIVCPEPSIQARCMTAAGGIVAGLVSWPLYGTAGQWP